MTAAATAPLGYNKSIRVILLYRYAHIMSSRATNVWHVRGHLNGKRTTKQRGKKNENKKEIGTWVSTRGNFWHFKKKKKYKKYKIGDEKEPKTIN